MSNPVTYSVENDIATVTMDDGKANAYGPTLIAALSDAFDKAEAEAKAVVLTGRPGVLSAGFDLKVMREGPEASAAMVSAGADLLLKMYLHPLPLVIACTGHAIAAGALILLTGDLRVATDGAFSIGLNETSIGMAMPPFGLEIARDRLDPRALSNAILSATLYDPKTANAVGYVDTVVDENELADSARLAAKRMTTLDLRAYAQTKLYMRQATVDRIRPTLRSINL
jgi:enoyl-CoA hydratase/carnithine racemase